MAQLPIIDPAMPHAADAPSGGPAMRKGLGPFRAPDTGLLMVFALACQGLAIRLRLRGHGVTDAYRLLRSRPRLSITLRRPVAMADLVAAIDQFNATAEDAALLVMPATRHAYAEQLLLSPDSQVVRVERGFVPQRSADAREVIGLILRLPYAAAHRPRRGPPRLLRGLRRRMRTQDIAAIEVADPADREGLPPAADALSQLAPANLKRLAQQLGFVACGEDCYADPTCDVAPGALLRGPLLITRRQIGPHEIHVGPALVTDASGPVSILERSASADFSIDEPVSTDDLAAADYFTGPAVGQRPVYERVKRIFDIAFSAAALICLLPLMILTALAIKLFDRGPLFYVHQREGLHGRPFGCVKFRTMRANADAQQDALRRNNQVDGPQFKIASDPRITPLGRILRMTNLDEVPQFWNVLRGEMSVVGPRPSPFKENQLCPPWREARLSVKPGITGLWQVSRSEERGAADFQEWILYDTRYVERRGFWLDLKIILLTIKQILGKGQ
jgi:lipopolysaccharide/colanic/teichoic acid biosynthesis glycosyltransferase